jgi:hypothetical protein
MAISTGAAILGSAAIGALSGGKNKTSTQSSAPVLPENVQKGYDLLIGDATDLSKQPYRDITRTRYEPSGMYGGLFDNPEMQALQQASDREYFANMQAPAPAPALQQQNNPNMQNQMYGQMFAKELNNPTYQRSLQSFTPQDYEELGKLAYDNQLSVAGSGTQSGAILSKNRPVDYNTNAFLSQLLTKYAR